MTIVLVILLVLLVAGLLWYRSLSRPQYPPLATEPDDPLLLEARERARASIPRFRELLAAHPGNGILKLRFVSNSDQVEYLWAEVLAVTPSGYDVRLITPPVTHSGTLERLRSCTDDEIEDWQVTDAAGKHHGAFSQRAMFAIARRDGVELPRKLREIEREYGGE